MALSLNLKLDTIQVTEQSQISVYFKHFLPNNEGKFVPTLYRNNEQARAKQQFVNDLAKTKEMLLDITATMDAKSNEWARLCKQQSIKFNDATTPEELTADLDEIIRQTMSAINKDKDRDLYEKVGIDLIISDSNREVTETATKQIAVAEDELLF